MEKRFRKIVGGMLIGVAVFLAVFGMIGVIGMFVLFQSFSVD